VSEPQRLPCTCTATHQPCPACLVWSERPPERRGRPRRGWTRREQVAHAELRLRGLTHHYAPGATTALLLPLAPLEVTWL
jgi:hypothetical protein